MNVAELQDIAGGMDHEEAIKYLARRVIAADGLAAHSKELCRRVDQQEKGVPMRVDYITNSLLVAQEAIKAYEATK